MWLIPHRGSRLRAGVLIAIWLPAAGMGEETMQIQFDGPAGLARAVLLDLPVNQQLITHVPDRLAWQDFGHTEKISYLKMPLDTTGAPAGYTPKRGDLAYYAPWENLAVFCQDFRYSPGLAKLGQIDLGLELFCQPGEWTTRQTPSHRVK